MRAYVLLVVVGLFSWSPLATAKKRVSAKKPEITAAAPQADIRAVSELMGPYKWGMTPDDVLTILNKQIDDRTAEQVKATSDVYEQDVLRNKATEEKTRLKKRLVKFDGEKSGWDVSIIDKEFGQKNDESMLDYWENDPDSRKERRRFFFFVDAKLWKMFVAFNSEQFEGKSFADIRQAMESRYGKGELANSNGADYVFWRSDGVYLRAIDFTKFYGNFCLAVSDDRVEGFIHERRRERDPKVAKENAIVDAVTKDGGESKKQAPEDPNSDVVDRLTGGGK